MLGTAGGKKREEKPSYFSRTLGAAALQRPLCISSQLTHSSGHRSNFHQFPHLAMARDRLRGGVHLGAPRFPTSLNGF